MQQISHLFAEHRCFKFQDEIQFLFNTIMEH